MTDSKTFNYIIFKNIKGTSKMNVRLEKPVSSLAELNETQATIIQYCMIKNDWFNFVLANELEKNCIIIDEQAFNIDYMKQFV